MFVIDRVCPVLILLKGSIEALYCLCFVPVNFLFEVLSSSVKTKMFVENTKTDNVNSGELE